MTTETDKPTVDEYLGSLTGFEEHAVFQTMGVKLYAGKDKAPTAMELLRSLTFIMRRREGLDDDKARVAAMDLPAVKVNELFAEEVEVDPEEPTTDAGKDAGLSGSEPTTSQSSVSSLESLPANTQP